MPFSTDPVLLYVGAGRYRLMRTCAYQGRHEVIRVPAGFLTDLASVPKAFWAVLPPFGVYENAAVLHDFLCTQLNVAHLRGQTPAVSSRDTDGLFRRVCRELGVGPVTRWVLWTGVRWGSLTNPARRPGWLADAPLVLPITAAALAATAAAVYGVHQAVSALLALV